MGKRTKSAKMSQRGPKDADKARSILKAAIETKESCRGELVHSLGLAARYSSNRPQKRKWATRFQSNCLISFSSICLSLPSSQLLSTIVLPHSARDPERRQHHQLTTSDVYNTYFSRCYCCLLLFVGKARIVKHHHLQGFL